MYDGAGQPSCGHMPVLQFLLARPKCTSHLFHKQHLFLFPHHTSSSLSLHDCTVLESHQSDPCNLDLWQEEQQCFGQLYGTECSTPAVLRLIEDELDGNPHALAEFHCAYYGETEGNQLGRLFGPDRLFGLGLMGGSSRKEPREESLAIRRETGVGGRIPIGGTALIGETDARKEVPGNTEVPGPHHGHRMGAGDKSQSGETAVVLQPRVEHAAEEFELSRLEHSRGLVLGNEYGTSRTAVVTQPASENEAPKNRDLLRAEHGHGLAGRDESGIREMVPGLQPSVEKPVPEKHPGAGKKGRRKGKQKKQKAAAKKKGGGKASSERSADFALGKAMQEDEEQSVVEKEEGVQDHGPQDEAEEMLKDEATVGGRPGEEGRPSEPETGLVGAEEQRDWDAWHRFLRRDSIVQIGESLIRIYQRIRDMEQGSGRVLREWLTLLKSMVLTTGKVPFTLGDFGLLDLKYVEVDGREVRPSFPLIRRVMAQFLDTIEGAVVFYNKPLAWAALRAEVVDGKVPSIAGLLAERCAIGAFAEGSGYKRVLNTGMDLNVRTVAFETGTEKGVISTERKNFVQSSDRSRVACFIPKSPFYRATDCVVVLWEKEDKGERLRCFPVKV
jgi:hypothetical protein